MSYNIDADGCKKCINDNDCEDFVNRKEFINKCIPLVNMLESKINILNFDQTNYIYYDENNTETYYLGKDFVLRKPTIITLPIYNYIRLNTILSMISQTLIIANSKITIPLYYMFTNTNNSILNLFTCQCNLFIKKINDKKILNSILVMDEDKFITLSYKFNIFNVSLLCNNFFDILPLLIDDNVYDYDDDDDDDDEKILNNIICKLKKIFEGFDLLNLYIIINNYKFKINNLSKKNDFKYFMEELKPKQYITQPNQEYIVQPRKKFYKYKKDYDSITEIEKNDISNIKNIDDIDNIYKYFANSIILIKKIFIEIKKYITNYDKLFLMSILSYRIKEKTINNTWSFDLNYILEYILCNKSQIILDSEQTNKLTQIYSIDKPTLYDYSSVSYKDEIYGNCMESTILQFLKILFYDVNENKYSDDIISKLIKPDFFDFIKKIFDDISNEKTKQFDLNWVNFITELPKSNNLLYNNFDFIKENKQVEINPTLKNLIIALKYLITDSINKDTDEEVYLNEIFKKINPQYYVNIIVSPNKEIINIFSYKKYIMELKHRIHAYFQNSKLNKNSEQINILENYKGSYESGTIYTYLSNNTKISYSDIISMIALNYIYNNIPLYKKYLNLFSLNIISEAYKLLFHDNVIRNIDINIIFFKNNNIFVYWNDDIWKIAINKLNDPSEINIKFWNNIGEFLLFNYWSLDVWNEAIESLIDFSLFWQKTINLISCCKWDNNIWSHVFVWAKSGETIFNAYKLGCYSKWDATNWNIAFQYCNLEEFYLDIFENNNYLYWNADIWNLFINEKNDEDNLWNIILDKKVYLVWNCEIWNNANENLNNIVFWEKIDLNQIMLIINDKIIFDEIKKTKFYFLDELCRNNEYYVKYLKYKNKYLKFKNTPK